MDHVRGIADQREAVSHKRARHRQAERIGAARTRCFDVAETEPETLFELRVEFVVGQGNDAVGFIGRFGPDDRRAPALQRQDRKRSGGQEMLFGAPVVIALVRNRGHDAGLIVVPAETLDAGAFADAGSRAIGRDEQSSPRQRRRH